ncbi:MAG: hypothetical protein M3439_03385 [Chloroflexota bacterium]|nr:hypothetical protein [Chloroflexota bacterium]
MIRRTIVSLVAIAGLVAAVWAFVQRRGSGRPGEHDAVQWPFEKDELRSLMNRVVIEQRERINAIEDASGRARAHSFLDYYERRRQATAS